MTETPGIGGKAAEGTIRTFRHPGSGRRRAAPHPRGRQLEPAAHDDIRALLGGRPRRRDLLIEHLHLIQDKFGALAARHLVALAEEMRLSLAEIYETATFYAHFDVPRDDAAMPPPLTVRVCDSLSCELAGGSKLLASLPARLGAKVRVVRAPCMGRCDAAPIAEIGHYHLDSATMNGVLGAIEAGQTAPILPSYPNLKISRGRGAYDQLAACRAGECSFEEVIAELESADLRGMGGAGFPATRKWGAVRAAPAPRLLVINADEGEPGTFKDRHLLERDPHLFLEGALIAAWAVQAADVYIYLRDEYPAARDVLVREIAAIEKAGLAGPHTIHLRRGAGAYICGEESAMIESIEGKRGLPRHRPPYVAQVGLFGRPTLVHNVETVAWIPEILRHGGAWFAGQGRNGRTGLRSFSVSGHVKKPGVKRAPAGITAAELIDEFCGGMADGHELVAYLPGGASGGILPARLADLPLDFGTLETHGCFIGSAAVIVLSQQDDLAQVALNLMRFFEDESCGQCTPCRAGTQTAVRLMEGAAWDGTLLQEVCATMADGSICGLGQAAPNPLLSLFRYFPEAVP